MHVCVCVCVCIYIHQVVWLGKPKAHSSWQPKSEIPAHIVDEYEKGIHQEIKVNSFVSGGQTISMLAHDSDITKKSQGELGSNNSKRKRLDTSHMEST